MNIQRACILMLLLLAAAFANPRLTAQCAPGVPCQTAGGLMGGGFGNGGPLMGPAGLGGGMPGYHPAAVMMGQEFFDPGLMAAAPSAGCCGPNWYDFQIEGVYMERTDAGHDIGFSSDGIRGNGPPNLVLSNDDLEFDFDPGIKASARYQIGAVYNLEVGFLGALDWDAFANASSSDNSLYSSFSDFGNTPFGGFDDVDQASIHNLFYRSDLDTVEISMRRSWAQPSMRIHGSWLAGVRYLRLNESFRFRATVDPHFDPINNVNRDAASTNYRILTDNDLVGFQMGGQLGLCLRPGINVTTEFKAGVYGNQADQNSIFASTTVDPALVETAESEEVAFVTDWGANLIYQIHPLMKLRAGYHLMYIDGVALASENFNAQPPFAGLPRTVAINDNGDLFLHGGTFGLEVGW